MMSRPRRPVRAGFGSLGGAAKYEAIHVHNMTAKVMKRITTMLMLEMWMGEFHSVFTFTSGACKQTSLTRYMYVRYQPEP